MLNIFTDRRSSPSRTSGPRVAIVGDRDSRAVVKAILGNAVVVVGELESDARIQLLDAVEPDIIFIDSTSRYVNPLRSVVQIAQLCSTARIVLLTNGTHTGRSVQAALAAEYNVMLLDIHAANKALSGSLFRDRTATHSFPAPSYAHVAA